MVNLGLPSYPSYLWWLKSYLWWVESHTWCAQTRPIIAILSPQPTPKTIMANICQRQQTNKMRSCNNKMPNPPNKNEEIKPSRLSFRCTCDLATHWVRGWGRTRPTRVAGRPSITLNRQVMTALNIAHDSAITVAPVLDKESDSPVLNSIKESMLCSTSSKKKTS